MWAITPCWGHHYNKRRQIKESETIFFPPIPTKDSESLWTNKKVMILPFGRTQVFLLHWCSEALSSHLCGSRPGDIADIEYFKQSFCWAHKITHNQVPRSISKLDHPAWHNQQPADTNTQGGKMWLFSIFRKRLIARSTNTDYTDQEFTLKLNIGP